MQIGEVIRTYRKRGNMTQEELASRLGVTAPAVNKWENGNSMPDITLLAPIARLLGVSLEELLSFREDLTTSEIRDLAEELSRMLKDGEYEEAFRWAKGKMEVYPNCERLIYQLALVLESWLVMKKVPDVEKYEDYILGCYNRLLNSKEEDIRRNVADAMFYHYLRKEEYEKAESYLEYFSDQGTEKKRMRAMIYSKTGRREEAYRCYEELLFAEYQTVSMALHGLYMLAMEEDGLEKAHLLADKQSELAKTFEMGVYSETAGYLELAVVEKDVDAVIGIMKKLLGSLESIGSFCTSPLYEHMTFKEISEASVEEMRQNLYREFQEDEAYRFVREDPRWIEELEG